MIPPENPPLDPRVGLCSACREAQRIVTSRGSVFWLCGLSARDPRFPRYPSLPVGRCGGYAPLAAAEAKGK